MGARGLGGTAENQHLAQRAALMTRAHKRDVDKAALHKAWQTQAAGLGFDAKALVASAMERGRDAPGKEPGREAGADGPSAAPHQADLFESAAQPDSAREAVDWALAHLSERDAVFADTDLLAAALAYGTGAASVEAIERAVGDLKCEGRLHDAPALEGGAGSPPTRRWPRSARPLA